jgi:hypothetical protein
LVASSRSLAIRSSGTPAAATSPRGTASSTASGGGDPILGYFLLDSTPADVTVTDGNSLTVTWAANGIVRVTQA